MLISKKLLGQLIPYVNDLDDTQIANNFNQLAIENENIIKFFQPKGLKIGKILSVDKHFNADSVRVCQVQLKDKVSQIVCGAKTLNVNANVIVAQDDITLAHERVIGTKDFRGVQSEGMMCDYSEISGTKDYLSDLDQDEIIELSNEDVKNFSSVEKLINTDDTVFDVSLPSNRNDLNGLLAIANELNALHNKKMIEFKLDKNLKFKKLNLTSNIKTSFFGVKIEGINYYKSNWKTKSILMNSGVKPLNNIQDIANVASIFSGIGLLGIDGEKVGAISIENLEKPISVETLNFGKVNLKKGDVVLKSQSDIIAIAGVDVCKKYAISHETNVVIFVAVHLNWIEFKKTIAHLKLMSNMIKFNLKPVSSYYFEQAFNNLVLTFKPKFKNLFVSKKFINENAKKIKLDFNLINQILGLQLTKNEIIKALKRFDIQTENNIAIVPLSRIELENNFDLAEEILKLNDFDKMDSHPIEQTAIRIDNNNDYKDHQVIANFFLAKGFFQLKTYNLTSSENNQNFNWFNYKQIEILNPISSERQFFKLSLLPTLLECYSYNSAYKNELLPIFEIQKIYQSKQFNFHLAFMIPSQMHNNLLTQEKLEANIHLCKDFLKAIENFYHLKFDYVKNEILKYTCDKDAVDIYYNGNKIGYLGRTCPNITKQYKISDEKTYLAEINLSLLPKNNKIQQMVNFENVHPIIKQLTFLLQDENEIENLYQVIGQIDKIDCVETIGYFKKENGIAITIKFNIINVKQNEVKLAFNEILKYFKQNNIVIPN